MVAPLAALDKQKRERESLLPLIVRSEQAPLERSVATDTFADLRAPRPVDASHLGTVPSLLPLQRRPTVPTGPHTMAMRRA